MMSYKFKVTEFYSEQPSLTSFRPPPRHFYFTATASRSRLTTRIINIAITILSVPVNLFDQCIYYYTLWISAKMDMATRDLLKKWNLERYIDRFESKLTNNTSLDKPKMLA